MEHVYHSWCSYLKGMVIPGTVLSQNHSNFILQSYQWDGQHANIPDTHKTAVIISVLGCLILPFDVRNEMLGSLSLFDHDSYTSYHIIYKWWQLKHFLNSNLGVSWNPNLMVAYLLTWVVQKTINSFSKDHGPLSCVRREIWFYWMWEMWLSILDIFLEDVKLFQGWKDLLLTKKKISCKKHLEAFKVMVKEMGGVLQVLMEETCWII